MLASFYFCYGSVMNKIWEKRSGEKRREAKRKQIALLKDVGLTERDFAGVEAYKPRNI